MSSKQKTLWGIIVVIAIIFFFTSQSKSNSFSVYDEHFGKIDIKVVERGMLDKVLGNTYSAFWDQSTAKVGEKVTFQESNNIVSSSGACHFTSYDVNIESKSYIYRIGMMGHVPTDTCDFYIQYSFRPSESGNHDLTTVIKYTIGTTSKGPYTQKGDTLIVTGGPPPSQDCTNPAASPNQLRCITDGSTTLIHQCKSNGDWGDYSPSTCPSGQKCIGGVGNKLVGNSLSDVCFVGASCSDSDGGNVKGVKGSLTGIYGDGTPFGPTGLEDKCDNANQLLEFFCTNNLPDGATVSCDSGQTCSNGACSGGGGCTNSQTQPCTTSDNCAGIRTCSNQAWGSCVKNVTTCGNPTAETCMEKYAKSNPSLGTKIIGESCSINGECKSNFCNSATTPDKCDTTIGAHNYINLYYQTKDLSSNINLDYQTKDLSSNTFFQNPLKPTLGNSGAVAGSLDIGVSCSLNAQCKSGYCFPGSLTQNAKCDSTTPPAGCSGGVNLSSTKVQKGISASALPDLTQDDVLKSVCTSTEQCTDGSTCISIKSLKDKGYISETQTPGLFSKPNIFLSSLGGLGGLATCAGIATISNIASPIVFPLCALAGGTAASWIPEIVTSFVDRNDAKAGYCIIEGSDFAFDKYFKWAAWFDVNGDGKKDGIDGLIIIGVLALVLVPMLRR